MKWNSQLIVSIDCKTFCTLWKLKKLNGDSNGICGMCDMRDRMNLSLISADVPEVNPNRGTMSEQEIQKKRSNVGTADEYFVRDRPERGRRGQETG